MKHLTMQSSLQSGADCHMRMLRLPISCPVPWTGSQVRVPTANGTPCFLRLQQGAN